MTDITPGISVLVPVYNSAGTLRDLVRRLEPILQARSVPFEVLLINDGSRDQSWQVISELAEQYSWVHGICLMRNYGQHNALLCGIRAAAFDTLVTIDDDLQNPPEEIPMLLAELDRGADVVYGAPETEQHGFLRNIASILTKVALENAMGANTARHVSAFRAFRCELRSAFAQYSGPFVSIDVLLTWATTRFTFVKVRHEPRTVGTSNYTMRRLIRHAMNMVTGFSTLPLQVASLLGFFFTLFGIAILALVVARYFISGVVVPGFTFLASIIAIFSGVQLFALGIIGEYLARMHFRMMERPPYAVRLETSSNQPCTHAPAHVGA